MANRVPTVSVPVEKLNKQRDYILELEVRLRSATPPEQAKQMRDHIEAMVKAIEFALSKACRGTRDMQQTRQLAIPQECLDGLRKAMQEPAIRADMPLSVAGPRADERPLRGFAGENPTSADMQALADPRIAAELRRHHVVTKEASEAPAATK